MFNQENKMKEKCSGCVKELEFNSGCYNTPRGVFCIFCYESSPSEIKRRDGSCQNLKTC